MRDVNSFVDEIAAKFGYSESLSNDLKRILPSMLEGKSDDKGKMLLDALRETKIYILPYDATVEDLDRCKAEVFGGNEGVTFLEGEESEYNKVELPAGAYISEPVFDSDMNITGRNRMIFAKELGKWDKLREVYGTSINLSHFIHEMGHMWAAEKNEYVQQPDGSFVQNVGAGTIHHSVDRNNRTVLEERIDGLFIEETLNTIFEEQTLLKLTGATSMDELKAKGYVPSNYQGLQKSIMESYVDKFGAEVFDEYRFGKGQNALAAVEHSLADTDAWETLGTTKYTEAKRKRITDTVDSLEVPDDSKSTIKDVFDKYDDVFFNTNEGMTPIQKLDNVFTQVYNFNTVKYNFGIMGNEGNLEKYKTVASAIVAEANALRLEAKDIEKEHPKEQTMMEQLASGVKADKEVDNYYNEENSTMPEKDKDVRGTTELE